MQGKSLILPMFSSLTICTYPRDVKRMDEVNARTSIMLFDVQMGVAGDMFLGALADLSEEVGAIGRSDLSEILVRSAEPMCDIEVDFLKERVSGITATGVKVTGKGDPIGSPNLSGGDLTSKDTPDGMSNWTSSDLSSKGDPGGSPHFQAEPVELGFSSGDLTSKNHDAHYHVSGARMKEYLEKGCRDVKLGATGESYAKQVLGHILEAEARIHSVPTDELHLHETGAPDTLVEIIGSAYLLDRLGMLNGKNAIFSTPVSVGMGSIDISHGTVPVPAPATLEILKEMPFKFGPINGELATPTGVSLLKGLAPSFITNYSDIEFIPRHIGYGFGKRKYHGKYLNVVRALIGERLE